MKSIDFTLRKIWVGNDPELREKVVEKLATYGITISASACCKDNFSCLWIPSKMSTFGTYGQDYSKADFDGHKESAPHTELTVEELLKIETYEIF